MTLEHASKTASADSQACTARRLPFVIRRDGTWVYRGSPVKRKAMLCLFSSMLVRDAEGRYWLRNPMEEGLIEVEDAPFIVTQLDFKGCCGRQQTLCMRTNMDELICIGADHPIMCDWDRPDSECAAVPYLHVRDGEGKHPIRARISRSVYFELAALAVPGHVNGQPCLGVWSRDHFFPLSRPV
ncbi:DUF1285 domain-containing protein [Neokomagataea tanensis]|uniref:DUF1285 domain-containing protein n=2 Tax=Neokomagataea TaxID=1223423 RepID=A0A4Y6V6Y3_9PROT|nr:MULTISPECIES: DUF1285 domain-containing protein [Neokomagataea]QDH25753.1 DUF1285 domain-containing protein [Neokomagataea tanensis]